MTHPRELMTLMKLRITRMNGLPNVMVRSTYAREPKPLDHREESLARHAELLRTTAPPGKGGGAVVKPKNCYGCAAVIVLNTLMRPFPK